MNWETVIGLEIHVQLATETKIFCGCKNAFGEEPNTHICAICTGQPGALPVLSDRAVDCAVQAALALNCEVQPFSEFSRKQYFYPDLPKGYQISQYDKPYALEGYVDITGDTGPKRIRIERIHMEEDAGKNVHGSQGDQNSYVDFNRAGSPLVEIVSGPDMSSADEAGAYLREVHSVVRYLGVSDADMEKGNFRCDANVSIRPMGTTELGTRTELKNINSFRFVEKAINYEVERQIAVIEGGGEVVQETRLWDTVKNVSVSMRSKEEAHDYRYFPEPDLKPLVLEATHITSLGETMPELPQARRNRFEMEYGLPAYDAGVLTADRELADYFEAVVNAGSDPKAASNWVMNEVLRVLEGPIAAFAVLPTHVAELIKLIDQKTISTSIAKKVFEQVLSSGDTPGAIVEKQGLAQIQDEDAVTTMVDAILAANPDEVERFRGGDQKLFGFFMGELMKASKGKVNPQAAKETLQQKLKGS